LFSFEHKNSGVQRSGDALGDCLIVCPFQILVLNSGLWWSLLPDTRCLWRHNMPSYLRLQTNILTKFVDKDNMHTILHALFLPVLVQCIAGINVNYQRSKLGDRSKTALNAKTERSSWLQIYPATKMQGCALNSVVIHTQSYTTGKFTTAKLAGCANVSSNSSWAKKICGWDRDTHVWQFETR